jgi:predicted transcriptional regulator
MPNIPEKPDIQIIQAKIIIPRMQYLGISKYRLAKMTGLSQPFLSQWFSGQTDISLSNFLRILRALEINPYFVAKEKAGL